MGVVGLTWIGFERMNNIETNMYRCKYVSLFMETQHVLIIKKWNRHSICGSLKKNRPHKPVGSVIVRTSVLFGVGVTLLEEVCH